MRMIRKKVVIRTSAIVLLLGLAGFLVSTRTAARTVFVNTASGAFNITGKVAGMYPGRESQLALTVENPQTTQLKLNTVEASVTSAVYTGTKTPAPAECAKYLSPGLPHSWTTWRGPTTVPAATSPTSPGSVAIFVPLSFADSHTNQNRCANITFTLKFSGSAYYTDPTTTGVIASPSPASEGAPVTLTATVSPTYSETSPTGTVTFSGPSGQIGAPVALSAAGEHKASATVTTHSLPAGTSHITATYSPSGEQHGGPDFFGSNAATNETVSAGCVTAPKSNATVVIAGTYKGNYEVKSGQSLWLNGGTVTGTVTVDAGGQFAATGGSIGGNLTANGATTVQGTAISGNAQSSNAAMSLGYGTNVRGYVHSTGGGPICLQTVTVGDNVQLQSITSSSLGSVCATTVAKDLQVQSNSEPMQIGGSASCTGNTVGGNLQLHSNSGKATVGGIVGSSNFGNHVTGNIQVESNTGGGTLVGNSTAGGNCQLQNNTPGFAGSSNTVSSGKTNTCNRTA